MTGKKDDACGHDSDSAITDELAPLRKWEQGMGSGSYTSGPTHLDRADFRETTEGDATASEGEAAGEAPTEPKADEDDDDANEDELCDGRR